MAISETALRDTAVRMIKWQNFRIGFATITANTAASIERSVKANVKRGTTLPTDGQKSDLGLSGYRHDPRDVGKLASHVVLMIQRAFSMMKR